MEPQIKVSPRGGHNRTCRTREHLLKLCVVPTCSFSHIIIGVRPLSACI